MLPVSDKTIELKEIELDSQEYENLVERCVSEVKTKSKEDLILGAKHMLAWASRSPYKVVQDWIECNEDDNWEDTCNLPDTYSIYNCEHDYRPHISFDELAYFHGWRYGALKLKADVDKRNSEPIMAP